MFPHVFVEFMSKKAWIWMRIIGWMLLLSGSIGVVVTLVFDLFDYRRVGIVNGLLSIVGTFFVLYGYYRLEKNEV
jgi:type III secretory pathway component EscS